MTASHLTTFRTSTNPTGADIRYPLQAASPPAVICMLLSRMPQPTHFGLCQPTAPPKSPNPASPLPSPSSVHCLGASSPVMPFLLRHQVQTWQRPGSNHGCQISHCWLYFFWPVLSVSWCTSLAFANLNFTTSLSWPNCPCISSSGSTLFMSTFTCQPVCFLFQSDTFSHYALFACPNWTCPRCTVQSGKWGVDIYSHTVVNFSVFNRPKKNSNSTQHIQGLWSR